MAPQLSRGESSGKLLTRNSVTNRNPAACAAASRSARGANAADAKKRVLLSLPRTDGTTEAQGTEPPRDLPGDLWGAGFGPRATPSPPSPARPPLLEGDPSEGGELRLTAQSPVSTGCLEPTRKGRPRAARGGGRAQGPLGSWGGPCPSRDTCGDLCTAVSTDQRNPTSSRNTLRTKTSLETSMGKRSCQRLGLGPARFLSASRPGY